MLKIEMNDEVMADMFPKCLDVAIFMQESIGKQIVNGVRISMASERARRPKFEFCVKRLYCCQKRGFSPSVRKLKHLDL